MTVQHVHDSSRQTAGQIVAAALQYQYDEATKQADDLAHVASNARATAREQAAIAEQAEKEGVEVRAAAREFERLLAEAQAAHPVVLGQVIGEQANDEGDIQTVLFPRPDFNRPYEDWPTPAA